MVTARVAAKDVGAKAIASAEKNMQYSLDYAQSLLLVTDLNEGMRPHGETATTSRMRSQTEQSSEMSRIVSRAAMKAAKPKIRTIKILISQILVF